MVHPVSDTATPTPPAPVAPVVPQPAPAPVAPAAPPAAQAPVPPVILVLTSPWSVNEFVSNVDGCDPITRSGTTVPSASVDQVIAAGVRSGVVIERR